MTKNSEISPEEQILQNALAPKIADIDGQRVEQHSLSDQIEAAKYAAAVKLSKSRRTGLRIAKMVPGGAE